MNENTNYRGAKLLSMRISILFAIRTCQFFFFLESSDDNTQQYWESLETTKKITERDDL